MAWSKAGSTTLASAGDDLDITSMTANKFLNMMCQTIPSGLTNPKMTLNNDTSGTNGSTGNYARRRSEEGGSEGIVINQTEVDFGRSGGDLVFAISYMINIATEEKLVIMNTTTNNGNGAGNIPKRSEMVWKWENTSDSITRTDVINTLTGDFAVDSNITALGSDGVESLNVQDGAVYYETDTNKSYVLSSNVWTEL